MSNFIGQAEFAKKQLFKNFADNNPLGKFFFKNADTVQRFKPGDVVPYKTKKGLFGTGKTFTKRGMAAVGVPLAGVAAWQGKKVYDDYAPKVKAARKLNRMINSITDRFNKD